VLLGNDLARFVDTVRIARWTRRIIWQNFTGTIATGIVLASLGFLNPLLAAFIHVASELVFILNSARLLPGIEHHRTPSASTHSRAQRRYLSPWQLSISAPDSSPRSLSASATRSIACQRSPTMHSAT
jgi:hypothetical protein